MYQLHYFPANANAAPHMLLEIGMRTQDWPLKSERPSAPRFTSG